MPLTVTAPPTVFEGARSYAERMGMTLEALMLRYLESMAKREHEQYGVESPRARTLLRVADENAPQWLNDISGVVSLPTGKVEELYGSLRLPPELEGKSDDELKDEYFREKYGVFG